MLENNQSPVWAHLPASDLCGDNPQVVLVYKAYPFLMSTGLEAGAERGWAVAAKGDRE
jgi:hypothetical protein